MNPIDYLLTQLASECSEVAHRVSKMLQFGLTETQPGQDLNNTTRLIDEMNDLVGVAQMLVTAGVLPADWMNRDAQARKVLRVIKYSKYAEQQGRLDAPLSDTLL